LDVHSPAVVELLGNVALLGLGLLVAIALLEGLTRVWVPISPGTRVVTADGRPVDIHCGSRLRLCPGLAVHEVSSEFDVTVTLTDKGNRVPGSAAPDLAFIGDSFTIGTGLEDDETFVHRYCAATGRACVNLGRSGTGTAEQLDVLEHYLRSEGWRPREVRLFMLVMTTALMAGNDLADNVRHATGAAAGEDLLAAVAGSRRAILARSNLARVFYFNFGPLLRSLLSPTPPAAMLDAALEATRAQLLRLDALSRTHGFRYRIYLLHPVQDLLRGTYHRTEEALRRVVPPGASLTGTAAALLDDPTRYYYPYNGHFNAAGAEAVTKLLLHESPA